MAIKLIQFIFFILLARSIPLYSDKHPVATKRKLSYIDGADLRQSQNRQEELVYVHGRSGSSNSGNEKEKMTIVPIAAREEVFQPFKFAALKAPILATPAVNVMPYNIKDVEPNKTSSLDTDIINQAPVEPKWFQPNFSKPNVKGEKQTKTQNSGLHGETKPIDIDKWHDLVLPNFDQPQELVLDFSPYFKMDFTPFKFYWPNTFGDFLHIGMKNTPQIERKPVPEIIKAPENIREKPDEVIQFERNLTVGSLCRFSSECKSRCCLRPIQKYEPQYCRRRALKGEKCIVGQLKVDVYYGDCPCLSGDIHCNSNTDKCDA